MVVHDLLLLLMENDLNVLLVLLELFQTGLLLLVVVDKRLDLLLLDLLNDLHYLVQLLLLLLQVLEDLEDLLGVQLLLAVHLEDLLVHILVVVVVVQIHGAILRFADHIARKMIRDVRLFETQTQCSGIYFLFVLVSRC